MPFDYGIGSAISLTGLNTDLVYERGSLNSLRAESMSRSRMNLDGEQLTLFKEGRGARSWSQLPR